MTTVAENAELPRVTTGRPSWLKRITLGRVMTHLALLFLVLAALATLNGRVEDAPRKRKRRSTHS